MKATLAEIIATGRDMNVSEDFLSYLESALTTNGRGNPNFKTDERIRKLAIKAVAQYFKLKWHRSLVPPTRAMVARLATRDPNDIRRVKKYLDKHWDSLLGMFDSLCEMGESPNSPNRGTVHLPDE